jgi:DeoR/GlpR family transcriptional regulator of sugar metabolism
LVWEYPQKPNVDRQIVSNPEERQSLPTDDLETPPRLRKAERRRQILLDLRLRPHVRVSELAERFQVSSETVRRDLEHLSADGLLDRAHGGASIATAGSYPGFDQRAHARVRERERIGRLAASLVSPGETLMIDSGSTTLMMARFLAFRGTPCTVVTNSFPVAMALGQSDAVTLIVCPGEYLPSESAVTGPDTVAFLERHQVDRCLIGASGLSDAGPSEVVRGFAAVKRAMLRQSAISQLLVDSEKFGRKSLVLVGPVSDLTSVICDAAPVGGLSEALDAAQVDVLVAEQLFQTPAASGAHR